MNITCIGSGAFSVAIASLLAKDEKNKIVIWSHDKSWVSKCEKKNELLVSNNTKIEKPSNISLTTSFEAALESCDILFLLTSSKYFLDIINELKYYPLKKCTIFIGTKGMLSLKPYYLSSYAKKSLKTRKIAYFAGPNFASDLLKNNPVIMTVATKKKNVYEDFKKLFFKNHIERIFHSDVLELASILKNIYAIGAGLVYGKYPSSSTNVSYTSLAYVEMKTLINEIRNHSIIFDIKGILGDFFLTNMKMDSRNFEFGLSRYQSSNDASNYLKTHTVEGYENLENIVNYLGSSMKYYPILYTIYDIIYKNKKADILIDVCFR